MGLLNTLGFYDTLLGLLDHMSAEAFLRNENRQQVLQHNSPAALLDAMTNYRPLRLEKWLTPETT